MKDVVKGDDNFRSKSQSQEQSTEWEAVDVFGDRSPSLFLEQ